MPHLRTPLVDDQNPCYCPELSPGAYIDQIRTSRADGPDGEQPYIPTFSILLDQLANNLDGKQRIKSEILDLPHSDSEPDRAHAPAQDWLRKPQDCFFVDGSEDEDSSDSSASFSASSSSEEDTWKTTSQYHRSSMSINDESFQLTSKASRIRNFYLCKTGHSPTPLRLEPANFKFSTSQTVSEINNKMQQDLEDELYGPNIGTETRRSLFSLIDLIDSLLPGIRLKSSLHSLKPLTHQAIVDYLGQHGHLSGRVLQLFRRSEISALDLSTSLWEACGLNMSGSHTLEVLEKPNSFQCLTELSICNTPLQDFDLVRVHHLPRLNTLLLNGTGIGNEAVFHLVALRRTLLYLHLEDNPDITDDAVPALLMLRKLYFLSLIDTGLTMRGMRTLARVLYAERRPIDIVVPLICEDYVHKMHTRYAVELPSGCVTSPSKCAELSTSHLRANLQIHAVKNPSIVVGGTKVEMCARLKEILERRKEDLCVKAMLWGKNKEESMDEDGEDVWVKEENMEE